VSGLDNLASVTITSVLLTNHNNIPLWRLPGALPASYHHLTITSYQRITSEPLLAAADWSVISDLAVGVLTTGASTGVSAVVVKTCQAERTLVIILTFSLPAANKWVSLVSSRTSASCSVSGGNTVSSWSTWVGVAWVRLDLAASDGVRSWNISTDALTHWVTQTIDIALSVGTTGTGVAWVGGRSPGLDSAAASDGVRLGLIPRQTCAHRVTLSVLCALSVGSTWTGVTGVWSRSTPVVVTDVAGTTVRVHLALSPAALDSVWHGDEAWQTPAHRVALSVLHTLSVGSTGRGLTRVWSGNTSLTLTHVSSLTVWVSGALWSTPGDGVRLGDQSWLTPTDGVTSKVDSTHSSRSTG